MGSFRESVIGDLAPRQVLILVEWQSAQAFESYKGNPDLAELHQHRVRGSAKYVWQLFDRLNDLRPLLKP
jgi:hypothetical protein